VSGDVRIFGALNVSHSYRVEVSDNSEGMMKLAVRVFAFLVAGVSALPLLSSMSVAQVDPHRPLKVALVLPGPVSDGTFNSAAAKGIKEAQAKYPNITVSIRENTGTADSEAALFEYARNGYDVVIGHGYQFAEPAIKIHKQFPKTWFIINTAKAFEAPNVGSFDNKWGDVGYVAGAVAGVMTKTGTIGTIGAIPVPVIQEYNEGFERGAKRTRPDSKTLSAVVGSFSDVAKAKEITLALIEKGADVVTATGNESVIGTLDAAKQKGVLMIGTAFDNASFAPDTVVTTALVNFDVNLDMAIGKILDGTIKPESYVLGFNENGVAMAGYGKFDSKISAADKAKIQAIIDEIKAGKTRDLPKYR
jgi:basic membrane protein A